MDNENKNMNAPELNAEFEIPDISALGEEFARSEEAEQSAPSPEKPKRTRKKAVSPTEESTDVAAPSATADAEAPIAATAPEKPKRTRKKAATATVSTDEAASESTDESDKPGVEVSIKIDNNADTECVTAEPTVYSEASPEVSAEAEAQPEAAPTIETETPATKAATVTEFSVEDAFTVDGFEIDGEGRRIIPEDYFPDDALSAAPDSAPAPLAGVTDVLGDPIVDENADNTVVTDLPSPEESTEEQRPRRGDSGYDPEKPRRIDAIFDFVELLVLTLAAVLFITSFFVKHAVVEGKSMLNTLEENDVLLISAAFYEPKPLDIIVIEDYTLASEDMKKPIVKRVIAVEGQLVKVTRDAIYVNGERLIEPYVYTDVKNYQYYNPDRDRKQLESNGGLIGRIRNGGGKAEINDEHYTFIVPENEIFVLGDHRNDSKDSRAVGTVREDAVLGKVLTRIYPFNKFGDPDAQDYE